MIRHPNITQLLDILETENSYYLVMELCTGGNLMHKMYDRKILEEAEVRRYIRQLTLAVEHLHRAGVVHRDLKIENLLLDEENNIKLIDFGLSNCAGILGYSDPFSTQCGSPAYAAPELLARKKYGPKVDIWSIGVNTFAMLTGTLPFTVEPFSLRALHQKMVDKDLNPLPVHLSAAAINFLLSLLEPDPIKRPNIQQVLSDHWLTDDPAGMPISSTSYPNRLYPEDLNRSVLLHMTEKMGYKNAEVVNTVLSNRASHTLSIYFLLNKKLDHYFKSIAKPDFVNGICYKNMLHQLDKYRLKDMQEEKKTKDPGKRMDVVQKPFSRKAEKGLSISKQSPCFLTPMNPSKVVHTDRKVSKAERGLEPCLPVGSIPVDGETASKNGYIKSSSLEYLEMHHPHPRTPLPTRQHKSRPLNVVSSKRKTKDTFPMEKTGYPPGMGQDHLEMFPQQRGNGSAGIFFSASNEQHECLSPMKIQNRPAQSVPMYDGKRDLTRPQTAPLFPSDSPNTKYTELANPYLVKSRGKFPMMGIGQMLRKRNQTLQLRTDEPIDVSGYNTTKSNILQKILYTAGSLQPQCTFHS
ncbi:hormonally up-regulated neu tumor-associated kinase homolog A isoform X2 [Narcine bancroftii]